MTTYLLYPKGTGSFVEAPPTDVIAKYLATPTAPVFIASNSPVAGMVLIATSATNATWQNPTAFTTINDLRINGNVTNTATAAGTRSVALGRNTYAAGVDSITLGPNTITGTSKSVVVGNDCSTVARTYEADGDQCVIIGSSNVITNAGGPGLGATYDYGIILGANNVLTYGSGGNYERGKNAVIGTGNVITMNHSFGGRRNYFMVSDHTISTDIAHGSSVSSNIIIGYGGSYTSDNTAARNNVIIGTTPTWSGCNNSVKIGNANTGAVKNAVVVGSNNTIPATDTCVVVGYNNDCSASNVTGATIVGSAISALGDLTESILIGYLAAAGSDHTTTVGSRTSNLGSRSIAIGYQATVGAFGLRSLAIGDSAIANAIYGTAVGSAAYATGDYGTAVGMDSRAEAANAAVFGRNARAQADESVAIGHDTLTTASGAVQIGVGTNSTANSLKFRGAQIHDGTTPASSKIVYKSTTAGNYKGGDTWNMSVNETTPPYTGIVAGRTGDPNNVQFADYDTAFNRQSTGYQLQVDDTCPQSCSFIFRDGVNFVRGHPKDTQPVHGYDQKWGPNTFWRYNHAQSTTNDDMLIPLVAVPPGHYLHMELTITAMRISGYDEVTMNYTPPYTTPPYGAHFTTDPGKIGGRSWSGIAAGIHYCNGNAAICRIQNNWGGDASDSDQSPTIRSVLGILNTGFSAAVGLTPYIGSALGGMVQVAAQLTDLGVTTQVAKFGLVGRGFSRWDTGLQTFGDYECQGVGFIDDTAPNAWNWPYKIFGMIVKGKQDHFVDWRITARCTMVPFAHPGSQTGPIP